MSDGGTATTPASSLLRFRLNIRGGLLPWRHHWGFGVRKDGLHYRAWKWRGKLVTPAKAVR